MKHCNKCKTDKPLTAFYKNRTKKDGLQTICRDCCNSNSKSHYDSNSQSYKDRVKHRRVVNTALIRERKAVPCADCKRRYPYYVMEFDHIESKDFNLGGRAHRSSTNKILAEMDKCDVVCGNCHAERTAKRAGYACPVSSIG